MTSKHPSKVGSIFHVLLQKALVILSHRIEEDNIFLSGHLDLHWRTAWGHIIIYCELCLPVGRPNSPTLQTHIFLLSGDSHHPGPGKDYCHSISREYRRLISLFWKKLKTLRCSKAEDIWLRVFQTTYCPLRWWTESKSYGHCQIHWRQPTEIHTPCTVGDLSLHSLMMQKDWKIAYMRNEILKLGRLRHLKKFLKK